MKSHAPMAIVLSETMLPPSLLRKTCHFPGHRWITPKHHERSHAILLRLHIGANSLVTQKVNGVQDLYATDSSGNKIDIKYKNHDTFK